MYVRTISRVCDATNYASTPSVRLSSGRAIDVYEKPATIVESEIGSIYMLARMQTTSSCTINYRIAHKSSIRLCCFVFEAADKLRLICSLRNCLNTLF